ncbi:MAG TPA: hypothetical protein ENI95_11405 [Chloroflexi bacterium]|nr:hypothetical protein [Chloroflexota bacterium]
MKLWLDFLKRLAIAAALILLANLVVVFFWSPAWFTYWQVPINCIIFICFLGVTLFDTLMRDRPR